MSRSDAREGRFRRDCNGEGCLVLRWMSVSMEAVKDSMDIGRCYKYDRRTVAEGLWMAGQVQWCTMKPSEGTGCLDLDET